MDATYRHIISVWPLYYERDKDLSLQDPRVTISHGLARWLCEDKDGLLSAVRCCIIQRCDVVGYSGDFPM